MISFRPFVWNYGMGVDSTAGIVGSWQQGERPDLIIHADTGGEKPETYAYLAVFNAWLRSVGFPEVTVVKYRPVRAPYDTLEGNCLANETLPSIAFRGGGPGTGGCSLKFKAEVMDAWILGRSRGPWKGCGFRPVLDAITEGVRPIKAIGYDDGVRDRKRNSDAKGAGHEDPVFDVRYPLQEWHWDRQRCVEEITKVGLPVPVKSACFFCPASKKHEIAELAATHPHLFARAIDMEDRAARGKNGLGEKRGLGINFRWRAWAEQHGIIGRSGIGLDGTGVDRIRARCIADTLIEQADVVQIARRCAQEGA